jgi:hypothetical protein
LDKLVNVFSKASDGWGMLINFVMDYQPSDALAATFFQKHQMAGAG